MKQLFKDKLSYILIYCLGNVLLEMLVFFRLGFGVYPKYVMFNLTYLIIVSGLLFVFQSRRKKLVLSIFLLAFQTLINCVNICYYRALGDIFSFDLLRLGVEAVAAFNITFLDIPGILMNVVLLAVVIFSLVVFTKNPSVSPEPVRTKRSTIALTLAVLMAFSTVGFSAGLVAVKALASAEENDPAYVQHSDAYLFDTFQFKMEAFKKFGSAGFYAKSLFDLSFEDTVSDEEIAELTTYYGENIVPANADAPLKDNNLLVIMLESFEWYAIDPILTPTLYSFTTGEQAFSFTNFRGRNKTNISEAVVMLGSAVRQGDFMLLSKEKDFAPENSLSYKFRDLGYTSKYFHPYDGEFYSREQVNIDYGFQDVIALQDVGWPICSFGDFYLDQDFIKEVSDDLMPANNKFYNFYLTVGTHGPYDKTNQKYAEYFALYDQNVDALSDYLETQGFCIPTDPARKEGFRRYKCAAMDTDRAIKVILDDLNAKNILDKTTIVLYSDHNSYYDNLGLHVRYNSDEVNVNTSDIYNIPFFIYDKTLMQGTTKEDRVIDTFCNTYDIYPTICELFGVEYSKNMSQGYNVFGDEIENSVFASFLTAMFTDKIYSFNIEEYFDLSNGTLTEEELARFRAGANKFYIKQEKIDKIYNNMINSYYKNN